MLPRSHGAGAPAIAAQPAVAPTDGPCRMAEDGATGTRGKGGVMARMAEPWGRRGALWPLERARAIWVSAVADEVAVRFNLRLLATLTALFSLPDLGQGLAVLAHATTAGAHAYGAYVAALGSLELVGAVLLARRSPTGRRLIMAAAAGFSLQMAP